MKVDLRDVRRAVGVAAVALAVASCGGSADDVVGSPAASTSVNTPDGGELAGVHFDVRRDPG